MRLAMRWKRNFSLFTAVIIPQEKPFVNSFPKKISKNLHFLRNPYIKRSFCNFKNHYDKSIYAKTPKTTTTNRVKIYHPIFCTKILTKNRAKWIFTNLRKRCIIKFPIRQPIRVGHLSLHSLLVFSEISILWYPSALKTACCAFFIHFSCEKRGESPFFYYFLTLDIYYIVQIVKIIEKGWKFYTECGIMI